MLMNILARVIASLVLGAAMSLTGVVGGVSVAQAAINDTCTVNAPGDGILDANGTCVETATLSQGSSCGSNGGKDYFYSTSGDQCVANGAVGPNCGAGIYNAGVCETPPTPPTAPTPAGFTGVASAGENPGGGQPMCVNASPIIGYGIGIVGGTVLCYTGAGKLTGIEA